MVNLLIIKYYIYITIYTVPIDIPTVSIVPVIVTIAVLTIVLITVTVTVTCIVVRKTKRQHTFELSTGILHVVIYSLCYFNRCSTRVY